MEISELDKWYSIKEYDPERKEIKAIIRLGRIKEKKILLLDTYGVMHIAPLLRKKANSVTAIHNHKRIINYCKRKSEGISFITSSTNRLPFHSGSFDAVISLWSGLHYLKSKSVIISELKRVLKDKGIVLIEEADEKSEFVAILNILVPRKMSLIRKKREKLKVALQKHFDVSETKLRNIYYFKNDQQLKGYFKKEMIFSEKRTFTKKMDQRLSQYLSKKKTLNVNEYSVFYVCQKKDISTF